MSNSLLSIRHSHALPLGFLPHPLPFPQKCSKPGTAAATALPCPEDEDYDFDDEEEDKDEGEDGSGDDDVFETVFDVLDPNDDKMKSLLETAARKQEEEEEENNNSSARPSQGKRQRIE